MSLNDPQRPVAVTDPDQHQLSVSSFWPESQRGLTLLKMVDMTAGGSRLKPERVQLTVLSLEFNGVSFIIVNLLDRLYFTLLGNGTKTVFFFIYR